MQHVVPTCWAHHVAFVCTYVVAWCWHMLRPFWNQSNILPDICQHFFCSPVPDEPVCCIPTWSDCNLKAPCKRTQYAGATSPNIVRIVLADASIRVFKRSQHVGQCCFYRVIPRGVWVLYLPRTLCENTMLSHSFAMKALDEYRRRKTRKCIAIAIALCHLENIPRHINKNRELKQWGRWTSTRTLRMQPPGSSVTRTKEMLAYVGQKVWLVSNWTQHMSTSCNIAQRLHGA